jgi:hypothetical protein
MRAGPEQTTLRRLYWWAFGLRFGLAVAAWLLMQFTEIELLQDAAYYEEVGAQIADDWLHGRESSWLKHAAPGQPVFMMVVVGAFYTLTLGVRALPVLFALYSAITAFTPGLIYKITRQMGGGPQAARFAGWLAALSPAFVFWSGALYKEGLILLVLALVVHHALWLQQGYRGQSVAVIGLGLLALFGLRFYLAIIVAAALGAGLLMGRPRARARAGGIEAPLALRQLFTVGLLAAVMTAAGWLIGVQSVVPEDVQSGLERVQSTRNDLANAPSGYLPRVDISTPERALGFAPVGMAYFLSVPLPWHTGSLRQNLAIPETACWLLLYPLVVVGIRRGLRLNPQGTLLLLLVTLPIIGFYGLMIGNIGTAYRLRIQVWLFWAVFAGLGWAAGRSTGTARRVGHQSAMVVARARSSPHVELVGPWTEAQATAERRVSERIASQVTAARPTGEPPL